MGEPRHAHEAERQIPDFTVYETDRGWLAVHKRDADLHLERTEWTDLFWTCLGARMSRDLRKAAEDLAARMAAPGRTWRTNDPGPDTHV